MDRVETVGYMFLYFFLGHFKDNFLYFSGSTYLLFCLHFMAVDCYFTVNWLYLILSCLFTYLLQSLLTYLLILLTFSLQIVAYHYYYYCLVVKVHYLRWYFWPRALPRCSKSYYVFWGDTLRYLILVTTHVYVVS